jgi:hypothetical protein
MEAAIRWLYFVAISWPPCFRCRARATRVVAATNAESTGELGGSLWVVVREHVQ